eukprot:1156557-Pelagomonas_calceolata.AAC.7
MHCRTCESLSVEALVLPNKAVVATDAFKKQVGAPRKQDGVIIGAMQEAGGCIGGAGSGGLCAAQQGCRDHRIA